MKDSVQLRTDGAVRICDARSALTRFQGQNIRYTLRMFCDPRLSPHSEALFTAGGARQRLTRSLPVRPETA